MAVCPLGLGVEGGSGDDLKEGGQQVSERAAVREGPEDDAPG